MSAVFTDKTLPRILVVDDSIVERNLFVHMVSKWGYPVEVAQDGEQAIELIRSQKIQLVMADWQMPGMLGTELCQRVRQMGLDHYTYIILMSAQREDQFTISAMDAGADDVLSKPIDANELEARLQSAVRRIELQGRLQEQTEEVSHAYDVIAQDLRTVSVLQRSYLPQSKSPFPDLSYRRLWVPSKYVSGDHLNVFKLDENLYGFYLLDVSGHGIPAAVKSMQLVQMFSDQASNSVIYEPQVAGQPRVVSKPRDVVARLNAMFQQTESDLSYFTMIYGVFDTVHNKVTICQAGHPSPFLIKVNGEVSALGQGGYPVGLFDSDEYEDLEVSLERGEAFMVYSDGVTEVMSENVEAYGEERLLKFMSSQIRSGNIALLPERIQSEVSRWGGPHIQQKGFEDDVSILILSTGSLNKPVGDAANAPTDGLLELDVHSDDMASFQVQHESQLEAVSIDAHEKQASIVIVDDSRSFLRIFEAMLNSWGYTVHAAKNGHEALDLIEKVQPDYVLTDWDMPGMSGIELCEAIRSQRQNSYTYIIMITGFASRDDLLRSLRVGADDFMTKPVNPSELKVRLKTADRISDLHNRLELRHTELTQLYESLQRDMREVSRIQRALLPKSKADPWPCAVQTYYKPNGYVCGMQMGVHETQHNEHGFFMISMAGNDTSTALQAIALTRLFSMAWATEVLFPLEKATSKVRRYLADPRHVIDQISGVSPTLRGLGLEFDLLYGLVNLDQGTLLVAGIGQWCMAMAKHGEPVQVICTAANDAGEMQAFHHGGVLHQELITPGTRWFVYPKHCGTSLGLESELAWSSKVLGSEQGDQGFMLSRDFSRLVELGSEEAASQADIALMGFQWREHAPVVTPLLPLADLSRFQRDVNAATEALQDEFNTYFQSVDLGAFRDSIAFEAVCDTVNIGLMSNGVREFAERMGYDDAVSYNTDLAISEALTNVMLHGYRRLRPMPTRLITLAYEKGLAVILIDKGHTVPSFVFDRIREGDTFKEDTSVSELPEGGMGLTFMRLVSQRFVYKGSDDHNQLLLVLT